MEKINAYWEKRNLGISTTEINIEREDSIQSVDSAIKTTTTPYQVMRVPSGKTDCLLFAQENGFRVIELNLQLSKKLTMVKLPQIYQRFADKILVEEVFDKEREFILEQIREQNLFITDKIARDPFFEKGQSGKRYALWTKDLLQKGGKIFIVKYKRESIGFCINIEKKNKVFEAFLGGLFKQYENKGLGFLPLFGNEFSINLQGGQKVLTGVSSNNLPILKLHNQFGYFVDDIYYVLIKHE